MKYTCEHNSSHLWKIHGDPSKNVIHRWTAKNQSTYERTLKSKYTWTIYSFDIIGLHISYKHKPTDECVDPICPEAGVQRKTTC